MKTIKSYISVVITLLSITSCTKVIDIKLNNETGKLTIEGNITNVAGPQYIKLSENVPFTNTNVYPPVSGATVTVTDQAGNNYPFTESPAGTYSNSQLTGIVGGTYTMSVTTGGKTYIAKSVMPTAVALDSLTSKNQPFNSGSNPKKEVTVYYHDPAGAPNYYRFVMFVNGVQVNGVFANDDEFTDGRSVGLDLMEDDIDVHSGDTVTVEMQCIDKPVYLYWFTLSQESSRGPNSGVTPSNPPTNITPATLGYFSAHSTQTRTIVIK